LESISVLNAPKMGLKLANIAPKMRQKNNVLICVAKLFFLV
jgi:hypothetical protein